MRMSDVIDALLRRGATSVAGVPGRPGRLDVTIGGRTIRLREPYPETADCEADGALIHSSQDLRLLLGEGEFARDERASEKAREHCREVRQAARDVARMRGAS